MEPLVSSEPVAAERAGARPLVSIGMPIRNERAHLREALDSLLAQSYRNLELIIADNGSDDGSREICEEYAARDQRIRYVRNERDLGALRNFNKVFELASGEYFMWASGHDLWSPGYVAGCVEVMETNPSVVLCSPTKAKIDEEGKVVQMIPGRFDTRELSGDPVSRLIVFHWGGAHAYTIYGVIRSSALRRTGLAKPVFGPDLLLMAQLSLLGSVAQVPEQVHYARFNRNPEQLATAIRRYRETWFLEEERPKRWFPYWNFALETLRSIKRAELPLTGKAVLVGSTFGLLARLRAPLLRELKERGL